MTNDNVNDDVNDSGAGSGTGNANPVANPADRVAAAWERIEATLPDGALGAPPSTANSPTWRRNSACGCRRTSAPPGSATAR